MLNVPTNLFMYFTNVSRDMKMTVLKQWLVSFSCARDTGYVDGKKTSKVL